MRAGWSGIRQSLSRSRESSGDGPRGRSAASGAPALDPIERSPPVEACAELRLEEPAVRDQRLGVGPVGRVEHLVHRRGEQLELVDQDHQRPSCRPRSAGCWPSRAAAGGSHRPPRAGSRWRWPRRRTPRRCPSPRCGSRGTVSRIVRSIRADPRRAPPRARCRRPASPRRGRATPGCRPRGCGGTGSGCGPVARALASPKPARTTPSLPMPRAVRAQRPSGRCRAGRWPAAGPAAARGRRTPWTSRPRSRARRWSPPWCRAP